MGCSASRLIRDPPSHSVGEPAPQSERPDMQWQEPHKVAPATIQPYDTRPLLNSTEPNNSSLNSANAFASLSTGNHTARTLPAFSFVNGGLMGPSSPPVLEGAHSDARALHPTYLNTIAIRAYKCERDLINAYYIYVHPYLPLLPPPAFPQYEDCPAELVPLSYEADRSILPFWPESPLALALSALLVLIPPPKDSRPLSEPATALRRSYAQLYVRAAENALDTNTEQHRQTNMSSYASTYTFHPTSPLHPNTPANLEPILALLVLTIYDYCERGNRKHMRSRAHQALTTAMDLSLHTLSPEALDAQKRAWWMTMYLASQASIINHSAPIMLIHDVRITTPYPEFRNSREPWELLMEAQSALMRAGTITKELARKRNKSNLSRAMADDMRRLDSVILALGTKLDTSEWITDQGAEASTARNLWAIALLFVHTARIKLHRFIAFGDSPLLLDTNCEFRTATLSNFSTSSTTPSQPWTLEVDSTFPFTVQESTDVCLRSALVLSRTIRNLPPPNPYYFEGPPAHRIPADLIEKQGANMHCLYPCSIPYLACCTMQSCYVLAMLLRRLQSCLATRDLSMCYYLLRCAQPGTEIQDAERAIEELRNGIGALYASLRGDSVFGGIVDMARDVETIYTAYFPTLDVCNIPL
ncbi:hypothetical protein BJY01DRAFT_246703 [Aspergillus pseudoustus]|uniref:Transcription factor domain-containing protein n=1 Tax=Aspergillus pseudoustus TaxID=1810923 RepID=A0ABR4K660_9EURO